MDKNQCNAEEIILQLREVDVPLGQGQIIHQVCKGLKELEAENLRLKRAMMDLTVDNLVLEDTVKAKG
ncbi:MAG TPA: hypothetical protein QGF41_03070 [Gammaproteobacteria bacterium]|nr:hypothetical protein [Gammaproteobacteria bacterium]|tara:strand:+ start:564 stop:767 length:204 start_codon:yes stop_codon:yes gene_type:complete